MMKKTAVVTGSASGIGLEIARRLLREGWQVAGMSRRESMEDLGENFLYISGDVSAKEDRNRLLEKTLERFGSVDALVNAAGMAPKERKDLLEMSEESYRQVMDVNCMGPFFLTQAAAKIMREKNIAGQIVNISSMSADTVSLNRGEYCMSKAALSMQTQLFAARLAEDGIMVNEIRPGIIETPMTAGVHGKYDDLIAGGLLPIARWGKPEDVAEAVWTLLSGGLPYMTGQSIHIDGGFQIRRL